MAEKHLKESLELELIKNVKMLPREWMTLTTYVDLASGWKLVCTVSIAFSWKLAVDFRVRMAFLSEEKNHALFTDV